MQQHFHYQMVGPQVVWVQCVTCQAEYIFDYGDIQDVYRLDGLILETCPSCAAICATAWYNLLLCRAQAIPAYLKPYAYRFN